MVGNGYVGIYTDTLVLVLWYPLVGKVAHLCRVKSYSNSRAHGIVELRCGHITSVSLGWAGVSCFGIVSGSVLCAMTDGESGSSLKLELRVITRTDS